MPCQYNKTDISYQKMPKKDLWTTKNFPQGRHHVTWRVTPLGGDVAISGLYTTIA
uniref:Uncharacterized protein n=1 Tax=Anguilla anguilla TaxID=7936 RepID=A0A0E9Q323_ANGAN